MKKNRKKLPRYWLGTRMPASLGYQPNQGAGNVSYSTKLGEDFTAEANAAQANILPSAINRLQQSITPLMNMWQNTVKVGGPTAGAAAGSTVANIGSNASSTLSTGAGDLASTFGTGTTKYAESVADWFGGSSSSAGSAAESAAGSTAGRTVLGTAGKALGIIGGAYGLANMAMDFAHNKDHRTAANMWDTVNTNTYTTDKGNTYNTYTAPNLQAELDYASAQKTSKNISNTIGAVGTGAAIGATIGSTVPVLGTAIGAGVGALYGLGSWLFGFGDTYEDTMNEYRKTQDVAALKSLQSEASAKNKDVKQGFYDRSNPDGRVGAAKGKRPVYTPQGPTNKKATARVSNGELIGNFEDGYVSRVPGEKNNKDTKFANLKGSDFVISNKYGLSDYAAATGDYVGALKMQDMLMKQYKTNAKNGKLPKCNNGWGDYALSTLPHLGSVLSNIYQYNRIKNAEEYAPTITTEAPAAQNYINQMIADRIDPRPYLNRSLLNYNQAAWNARRTPGLGLGGRMVMLDSLNRNRQASDADVLMKIDEANRVQRNKAYEAGITLDKFLAEQNTRNQWMQYAYKQQAHGQKETWLAQYLKNMDQGLINAAGDALRTSQFHQAQDIKNRELNIWQQQVDLEKLKRYNDLAHMGTNNLNPVQNFIKNWFFAGNRI